jgi:drug/metabolite transporter (DMT)-like permease
LKKEAIPVTIRTGLLGIVAIVFLSLGQTSLKVGLNHGGGFSLADGMSSFGKLLTTPWFLIGFVCYGLSSVLWMDVLSKLDFSLAFPMVGSVYVFNLLIGRFFFHEMFGWERMIGVGLILFGICCLVKSGT